MYVRWRMGETLELTLRVQIGVGRYLMFNPRPSGGGAESVPLQDIRDNLNRKDVDTNLLQVYIPEASQVSFGPASRAGPNEMKKLIDIKQYSDSIFHYHVFLMHYF